VALSPGENDAWMLRDFTRGAAGGEPDGAELDGPAFDAAPLVLVIGTQHDLPVAHLCAGQAMQRVLLTATAIGLSCSVLSAPVEVDRVRRDLARLTGPDMHPQILVRVGHGDAVPAATPRVDPAQLWG
jgi:Nitroreductase family